METVMSTKLKIWNIYREIVLNIHKIRSTRIEELYVEYLKLSIMLGTNNPIYEDDAKKYRHCNCYCYALGIDCPPLFYKPFEYKEIDFFCHNLGFLSGRNSYYKYDDAEECLDILYSDLGVLNIKVYDSDVWEEAKHGGYKIAFYLSPDDFHFFRQNQNGMWSDKRGYAAFFHETSTLEMDMAGYKYIKTLEIVKPLLGKQK